VAAERAHSHQRHVRGVPLRSWSDIATRRLAPAAALFLVSATAIVGTHPRSANSIARDFKGACYQADYRRLRQLSGRVALAGCWHPPPHESCWSTPPLDPADSRAAAGKFSRFSDVEGLRSTVGAEKMDFIKYYACVVRVARRTRFTRRTAFCSSSSSPPASSPTLTHKLKYWSIYTDGKWPLSLWRVSSRYACSLCLFGFREKGKHNLLM
jgi:hypothetical protein